MRRVYIHGSGRTGTAAWPKIDAAAGSFVAFDRGAGIRERVAVLEARYAGEPAVLFAHSLGGVPAVLAVAGGILDVRALVLVEPALYDIARGDAAIERHIAVWAEARSRAGLGDLRGFWAIVRPVMFGGPLDDSTWPEERQLAEQWAVAELPWGHEVRSRMLRGTPTLVVTGGWNAEYEAIAAVLVENGATHRVLTGAQHRPQDLPAFGPAVAAFLHTVDADLHS